MRPAPNSSPFLKRLFCTGTLLLLLPGRTARAEDSVSFKAQSWQEDGNRIRVDSQYALLEKDLTADTHVKVMGLIDSIAGATPTGEMAPAPGTAVPTANMDDERKAWDITLSHQFQRVNVSLQHGVSRESDYVSKGYSLNTVTDFNQKNTLLLLGWGHTDDRIMEGFWSADRTKTGDDLIVGLTQLLDPATSVTANVSWGRATGYLSDPYKLVSTTRLVQDPGFYYTPPENRPGEKEKVGVFLGLNRHFERLHGAADASYRYYSDTFGIRSHTVDIKWIQRLGDRLTVTPSVRYYRQGAADFYYVDLDRAGIDTSYDPFFETGTGNAPYYSSDYRLSRMETLNLGLQVNWSITPDLSVDAAIDRYLMHGLDAQTPDSAYADATVFTVGLKLNF